MIQNAGSYLNQEAVEPENLMGDQDLVRDLGRASRFPLNALARLLLHETSQK